MNYILLAVLIVFLITLILGGPCTKTFETKRGNIVKARDYKTAEVLDVIIEIAHDLPNHIRPKNREKLSQRLKNTSFVEIIDNKQPYYGWNYEKGREVGIRIYKNNVPIPAKEIVDTLLHELAHSVTVSTGHGEEWEENNYFFQKNKPKYVALLLNKTFLSY